MSGDSHTSREVKDMARKLKPDEVNQVKRQPEGHLWLVKAGHAEILERLKCEGGMVQIHPCQDDVISYRIDDSNRECVIVHVWR